MFEVFIIWIWNPLWIPRYILNQWPKICRHGQQKLFTEVNQLLFCHIDVESVITTTIIDAKALLFQSKALIFCSFTFEAQIILSNETFIRSLTSFLLKSCMSHSHTWNIFLHKRVLYRNVVFWYFFLFLFYFTKM